MNKDRDATPKATKGKRAKKAGAPTSTPEGSPTRKKNGRQGREPMVHVAVRISARDVERIDTLAQKYSTHWFTLKRSDMLRKLIHSVLNDEERIADQKRGSEEEKPAADEERGPDGGTP